MNATSTTIFTTKQNNLTFSNPFLNTSNTVSLKYDDTKLNIDASGNLTVINGTSQWTTTGPSIFYKGGSSSQPLVRIEQTTAWPGTAYNYALQVVGYSDFNGIRINGVDTSNTIYTTGANDMALSTNAGAIKFNVNGAERMIISSDGIVKCKGALTFAGELKTHIGNLQMIVIIAG